MQSRPYFHTGTRSAVTCSRRIYLHIKFDFYHFHEKNSLCMQALAGRLSTPANEAFLWPSHLRINVKIFRLFLYETRAPFGLYFFS